MATVQRTVRLPGAVDAALRESARQRGTDVGDLITDVLSRFALAERTLAAEEAERIRAELALKEQVRQMARELCAASFDPHVILRCFQRVRSDPTLLQLYGRAIGGDPFARGQDAKARLNRTLGTVIRAAVGGNAAEDDGVRRTVAVEGELVQNYTPLRPA